MERIPETYNEEMTKEFYVSYSATVQNSISKLAKPVAKPPLQSTLVWGFQVDISEATIRCFIYAPTHTLPINTAEYDYKMGIIQSGSFQRDRPAPTIDVTTFQMELASLRADVAALLGLADEVPESVSMVPENEVVMNALFGNTMPLPDPFRAAGKCHHSDHTSDMDEA
uniref:Integrase core domain containing protein n=1 Tax=Solanum tuberosum TaxID=4113 RepID=M1DC09_SOLTU